jgi:ribosome maturation factor RimP
VPTFFSASGTIEVDGLQAEIESRLARLEPGVEVLMLEQTGPDALRLYIDREGGVDLALCESVTGHLRDLLEEYALEVSSPGSERPLTKPEHFRRYLGHRVRVRTREAIEGKRSFTGRLTSANEDEVCLEYDEQEIRIPHERIGRSNLVPEELER